MWTATVLHSDALHQACSVGGVALKIRMGGPEMGLCSTQVICEGV